MTAPAETRLPARPQDPDTGADNLTDTGTNTGTSTGTAPALLHGEALLDPAAAGHKFSRLAELRAAGFAVPDLFGIPAAAFDRALAPVLADLDAPPAAAVPEAVRRWSEKARAAVLSLQVDEELADAVLTAFDEVIGADGLAAVRACVVPGPGQHGEDSSADPFAGLSDSFLYVPRAGLLRRIVECWASAYNAEGVLYRLRRGADPGAVRVAVGVQRMVLGASSFVAFTRDPRDGADRVVVAAAYGIGEGVVQERADVDHYFTERATGAVRTEIAVKRRMVGAPEPGGPAEPSEAEVPAELAEQPVLSDGALARVVETAYRIEEHFGRPQDIEGAFAADGELWIVQSRPLADLPEQVVWSNHNITESYPGVSCALTYSLARDFYKTIFTDLYRRMGIPEARLRENAHHLERMVGLREGRVYYRLDAWYALHGMMSEFEFIRDWWEHSMGLRPQPGMDLSPGWRGRALRTAPGTLGRSAGHFRRVRGFLAWWDRTAAEAGDLESLDAEALIAFYRGLWAEVGAQWGVTLTNTVLGIFPAAGYEGSLRRWTGSQHRALFGALLAGGPENRTLAGLRGALELSDLICARPEVRDRILNAANAVEDAALWQEIVDGGYGPEIADAARRQLRLYGDRAVGDLKLEQLTPRQRPAMVLDMLRPHLRQITDTGADTGTSTSTGPGTAAGVGTGAEASRADERKVRADGERQLREQCRNPLRRVIIRAFASRMRAHLKAREDTRFCRTELFGLSRRVLLRLGVLLAGAGRLDDPRDVLDLTVEEVLGAFDGTLPGSDLRVLAALRRADRERWEALPAPPPRLVSLAGRPLDQARPATAATADGADGDASDDENVLRGLASSAGVVRARARVVLDPDVPADTCRDAILIARETDPGWLFLMTAARGLVVERGTLLSHTAVTGRLLGVPTVVAVDGATTRIPDGALIELDGAAGTVRILAEEAVGDGGAPIPAEEAEP
ncbi:PEP/pyruvate-binding domain-containing protein [Catenulispora rubra]|uniref:PEP/pyruvate-binding domain-containing protein n=1 Tax=Catenulispora rubra TaxID=280293 RepID=UPI00189257F1|nr:PEP/pyruvate-binding domain-containing protein [Catenulispora rubra]